MSNKKKYYVLCTEQELGKTSRKAIKKDWKKIYRKAGGKAPKLLILDKGVKFEY